MEVDRLGQQLGETAAQILDHPPLGLDLAAEIPAGAAVDVGEILEPHSEAAGIAEDDAVAGRKARRPGVHVQAGVEVDVLVLAAHLYDFRAAAQGPGAAADPVASFDHGHLVAGAAQLVGRHQSGDSGAEDNHRAAAAAGRCKREILRSGWRRDGEAHGLHRQIDRAGPADRSDAFEQ